MSNELFDFGFTAVDESELEAFQQLEVTSEIADDTQERLDKLFNAIQPLLTNLKLNPEKEYILWILIVLRKSNSSSHTFKTSIRDPNQCFLTTKMKLF